jgi:hypothetical protein
MSTTSAIFSAYNELRVLLELKYIYFCYGETQKLKSAWRNQQVRSMLLDKVLHEAIVIKVQYIAFL